MSTFGITQTWEIRPELAADVSVLTTRGVAVLTELCICHDSFQSARRVARRKISLLIHFPRPLRFFVFLFRFSFLVSLLFGKKCQTSLPQTLSKVASPSRLVTSTPVKPTPPCSRALKKAWGYDLIYVVVEENWFKRSPPRR